MAVYIRPFKITDLDAFETIEEDINRCNPEWAKAIENSGLAITGIREGKIFGSGGVHPLNEEQGEIWMRLSKDCLDHKLDTLRWIREGFKIIEDIYPFREIIAMVRCDFTKSIKLVKFLGFAQTGTKEDMNIYSKRVKE